VRAWRKNLPGGGFLLLVASWGGLAAFLAWGLVEPDLDRSWRVLHEADRGAGMISPEDVRVLDRSIALHPEVARDRLGDARVKFLGRTTGGWSDAASSYLVIGPPGADGLRLQVECRCASRYPTTVLLEIEGAPRRLTFEGDGVQPVEIRPEAAPHGPDRPFLARLVSEGVFGCAGGDGAEAGVRVSTGKP